MRASRTWGAVDLDRARLHIRQTDTVTKAGGVVIKDGAKTGAGVRAISIARATVQFLRGYRAEQAKAWLQLGQRLQDDWLLFPASADDPRAPHSPYAVGKAFAAFARADRRGFAGLRFYDLRHSWATLALKAGTNIKVVSAALGHASVKLTWDVYSHVLDEMHDDAAAKVATFLPSTL